MQKLKSTDLRIGNLIKFGEIIEDFKPIPLSKEWFIKKPW